MAISPSVTMSQLDLRLLWRHIFAGLSASFVDIGLARFAYSPLIPALIQARWFTSSDVIDLGAANLAGYLFGALLGRPIAKRLANVTSLRLIMTLITVGFIACSMPVSASWFFVWRFLSPLAGGAITVQVAVTVLPRVPPVKKGIAGGAIFLGLGVGIAASGALVSLLLLLGAREAWLGLAIALRR